VAFRKGAASVTEVTRGQKAQRQTATDNALSNLHLKLQPNQTFADDRDSTAFHKKRGQLFARKPRDGWVTWGNEIPRERFREAAK
jgi:hypothetical protein